MMSKSRNTRPAIQKPAAKTDNLPMNWRIWLALIWLGGPLFFWPDCLDRYHAPRFFWLSAALYAGIFLLKKSLDERGDWRLHLLDLAFFGWYAWNVASVGWAFSFSEAIFFSQKVLVTGLVYWFSRQLFFQNDDGLWRPFFQKLTVGLSLFSLLIGIGQLVFSISKNGLSLQNDALYAFVSGLSGNKGLFADWLFFLLIFNGLCKNEFRNRRFFWLLNGALLALIFVLQTRTIYVAVGLCSVIYFGVRAWTEVDFRPIFRRRILPIGLLAAAAIIAFIGWKGRDMSMSERLNPLTWLESASANERRFVWYKTGLLADDFPLRGVGNGAWKIHFPAKSIQGAWRLQEKGVVFTRVHNDWLEIRAELGWIGLALFCLIWGLAATAAISVFRKTKDENSRHDLLVAGCGLVGYAVISTFDFPRERMEMQVVFALLLAVIAWRAAPFFEKTPGFSIKSVKNGLFFALVTGLVFNLLIGWNRIIGEIHNVRIMKNQVKQNFKGMADEARKSKNRLYEYNDVVLPIDWFEGLANYQMNNFDGALVSFSEAYRLNPWSFQVLNNYASILVKKGKFREALPIFERTLEINPKYDEGKFNMSYAYFQLGEFQKALDFVNSVDTTDAQNRQKRADFLQQILPNLNGR